MSDRLGDKVRLQHILLAIKEIKSYTEGATQASFSANSMMKFATFKQLEIIGEAANRISDELKEENKQVAWRPIIGLRNMLVHEYFGVDVPLIWGITQQELLVFETQAEAILQSLV